MIICLIGIDGSGKTTQAKKIVKYLNQINLKSTYYHPGRGRNSLFKLPFIILYYKIMKKSLVCDRGYYDTLIGLFSRTNNFLKIKKCIFNAVIRTYPKFDHVFIFYANFHTLLERKKEIDKEQFENRMNLYKLIQKRKKHHVIDAEQSIDSVFYELKSIIGGRIQ